MSWDSYIDTLLPQTSGHADKACIIGLDGKRYTTDTPANAIKITEAEAKAVAKCFQSKDFTAFQASGVHVGGTKYQFLRVEDDKTVFAKKKEQGALTLQASKTAIVIAHTIEGGQQGNTNKGVAYIADYLEGLGM